MWNIASRDLDAASYRMAGDKLPDAIRRTVEEGMRGEALDVEAERAARSRGWR